MMSLPWSQCMCLYCHVQPHRTEVQTSTYDLFAMVAVHVFVLLGTATSDRGTDIYI